MAVLRFGDKIGNMDGFPCEECQAIFRDLWEAHRANAESGDHTPEELEQWIAQLNIYDCAGMRATSDLWKAWRAGRTSPEYVKVHHEIQNWIKEQP